jgi:hypothetical protein
MDGPLYSKLNLSHKNVLGQENLRRIQNENTKEKPGTKNEICVSLVYSGNGNKISFTFPLYTRETQISFFVPDGKNYTHGVLAIEKICKI